MKRLFLLIPALALMAACQKEIPQGSDREVEIRIMTGSALGGAKATRAPGDLLADDAIMTVDMLVFDNSGGDHDNAKFMRHTYAWEKNPSQSLWSAIIEGGTDLDIYFAINARDAVESAVAGKTAGTSTFADIQKDLVLTGGVNLSSDGTGLPMWGYRHNATIVAARNNSLGTVKVLRAVAAAEIKFENTANFELTHGSIRYASTEGFLAYTRSNIAFEDESAPGAPQNDAPQVEYSLIAPEVPTAAATSATVTAAEIKAKPNYPEMPENLYVIEDQLFFYENDKDDTAATATKNYTKVVVGGTYDPTPAEPNSGDEVVTYYPLAFRDRVLNGFSNDMVPIIRNIKFQFVITKVNGKGFDTPDIAKDAEPMNIEYDVIQWNEWNEGDITTWGPFWLSVGKSRNNETLEDEGTTKAAYLYRNAKSEDVIEFSTNVGFDDYVLTLSGPGSESGHDEIESHTFGNVPTIANGGLSAGEEVVDQIANAYYEIYLVKGGASLTQGGTKGRLIFVSLQNYADRTANPSASTFTISSGEIKYSIDVMQGNSSPEDWIDDPVKNPDWGTHS